MIINSSSLGFEIFSTTIDIVSKPTSYADVIYLKIMKNGYFYNHKGSKLKISKKEKDKIFSLTYPSVYYKLKLIEIR